MIHAVLEFGKKLVRVCVEMRIQQIEKICVNEFFSFFLRDIEVIPIIKFSRN